MKVGGPFEVAIVGLDAFNEFSKGKTGKQSLQTALSMSVIETIRGNENVRKSVSLTLVS